MNRKRVFLTLVVAIFLIMLASPLYAGAATTAGTGGNSGQNNSTANSQLQEMGFNTAEQQRLDPDGNKIDKNTQNPFGVPQKTFVSRDRKSVV